ncbi:hypothetical protein F4821DRAFT_280387 [Hypoxylon rubiginosum]|uniref:Uncharacterized protein n=1 Tax=Hypoxylon rubiginosum TaxID=110542 RepID=A0ACC0CUK0_9PEZI|nr:hypothetical protein F4821DRAFT_280387 [Hypoxylon rubiginosum]
MKLDTRRIISSILFFIAIAAAIENTRFREFFPVHKTLLIGIRDHECEALWAIQQTETYYTTDGNCPALLSCILESTNEAVKGNFGSGLVALGLMPTLLTFLGSAVSETALLARRRPLLALLIASGSPAVNPLPTFMYDDPLKRLEAIEGRLLPPKLLALSPLQAGCIVLIEYLLVLGAIANIVTAGYYAGEWTINTIACDDTWYPIAWVGLTIMLHICGMIVLDQRVRTVREGPGSQSSRTRILNYLRYEFSPCIIQGKLVLERNRETYIFVFVSWFSSISTVAHILFGTVAFSSLTFIGYIDSIKIIGRFMASAAICRAVLMFELAGLRNAS